MNAPTTPLGETIYECFSIIDDPRAANAAHPLNTVLFCLIVGVVCGADGFVQAEEIARLKKPFIRKYVPLRRDTVPTHDTMARVLGDIDPEQFLNAFATFMSRLSSRPRSDIINLDGKTLRGVVGAAASKREAAVQNQAHIISAFSSLRGLVLGQVKSKQVAHETAAAQELLRIIDVKGAVVTMDAAHSNPVTLKIIADRGGDYVVAVKGNAKFLQSAIVDEFRLGGPVSDVTTSEKTHGQIEHRTYEVIPASKAVAKRFPTVKSFIRVEREGVSHSGNKQQGGADRLYASSLPADDSDRIAKCIRARWSIENSLHYVLDISFDEDRSRIRSKNAPENFSRVRHIALGLLGMVKGSKRSFAVARIAAGMDDRFLARVLRVPSA
jgi:predicted transposase YbfD/YdcC